MRRRNGRTGALVGAMGTVLAVCLLAASCSKSPDNPAAGPAGSDNVVKPEETPVAGGKLAVGVMADTNGWSNISALWADVGNFMGCAVLEPLMMFDAEGTPQPWLAESITAKTPGSFDDWIIKVKPNIKFHNGETLDAAVVAQNLNINTKESLSAVATKDLFTSIEATDPMTVEVKLAKPWSAFPGFMANASGYINAKESLAKGSAAGYNNDHPIGTGPFQFVSWQRDSSSKFKRFADYWQKGHPYVDELEFKVITDNKQRAQALRSGDLDMIFTFSADDAANLTGDYQVVKDYNSEKLIVMFNTAEDPTKTKNPLANAHVRKALAAGTDNEELKQLFGGGLDLQTSTTPLNAASKWKMDESQTGATKFDLEKAKAEIEAYKKETGDTTVQFQLIGQSNIDEQRLQQALQQQWKKFGVDITLDTSDQSSFVSKTVLGGFQAAIFRNYGYIDPDSDYYFFHSSTAKGLGLLSINFHQWKDPAIDKDLDEARGTDDFTKRKALYEDLTKRVNDANINIWLYNTPYALIATNNVKGLNQARTQSFGNYLPKTWLWNNVWKKQS